MKMLILPALLAGALCLAGCADGNYRPYRLDDSFGKSAKQMVKASIADPQAAANPPLNAPRKMDGYAGVTIMKSFRASFGVTGTDAPVQPPSQISIGTLGQ
jgi:hypothetical protein